MKTRSRTRPSQTAGAFSDIFAGPTANMGTSISAISPAPVAPTDVAPPSDTPTICPSTNTPAEEDEMEDAHFIVIGGSSPSALLPPQPIIAQKSRHPSYPCSWWYQNVQRRR